MMRKNMLKAAIVTLIALAMIFPVTAMDTKTPVKVTPSNQSPASRDIIFEDSFETYEDWLIDFPPWTCIDVDGSETFIHSLYTWPHQTEPYAFIIFNPDTTTPPSTEPEMAPHTGDKEAMAINDNNAGYISDDWLITPQLAGSYDTVTFWAHSYSAQYQLERITVCVSTTDTDPASFTMISPDPYVIPPLEWTEYSYDISSYSGQAIYIGIHYVSVDSWMLFVDDFVVTGSAGDIVPPTTTATLAGDQSGGVYTSDVTVTLTATDAGSGVNYTMYKIDTGAWQTYTATPFVVSGSGEHTVAFYSVDLAGNVEAEKNVVFTIEYPLEITIKGGMGVSVIIKNTGTSDVLNANWNISITGFSLKAKELSGTILQIPAGGQATKKLPVLGFGKTGITAVVNGVTSTKQGFIFLVFVLGVK